MGLAARRWPLGALLAALVLTTAMPLLALVGFNIARETRVAVRDARSLVASVATDTAGDVHQFFTARQRLFARLARSGLRGAAGACTQLIDAAAAGHDGVLAAAVRGGSGEPVCSEGEAGLLRRERGPWPAGRPSIGRPFRAGTGGGWAFVVTYPLEEAGGAVLQVALRTDALGSLVDPSLRDGSASTLMDDQGVILARFPAAQLVGTRVEDPAVLDMIKTGIPVELRGADGVERVYAARQVGQFGLWAIAGVAAQHVYGPVWEHAISSALFAGAALGSVALLIVLLMRRLRAARENNRTMLEKLSRNVPGMIFEFKLGPDGRATVPFASEGIVRMFEMTADDTREDAAVIQGRIHPDDAPRVAAATRASLEQMSDFSVEYRVRLPRQGLRHYLTRSQPERHEDGSVLWHGCTIDITELRDAREANAALESFSYSVAHDLRAPLHAINGFSQALPLFAARGDLARVRHFSERIALNGRRMIDMIDGLLALAGLGRGQLDPRPHDLGALVRGVVADLQVQPQVELRIEALPVLAVDAVTMRQVFENLLRNAVKFSAQRDKPRIEVGCVDDGGDEIAFFVRDNGAGFDPAVSGRLFEVFNRLHGDSEFEGTGVGLAIVRRVVQQHGGRVWAEGRVGEGATFWFALPGWRRVNG